jgi:hypothetical protein
MKKIVITTFIMPNEIDDLERLLIDLNKASKFVDGDNYELYLSLSVDDYLVDWSNSKLDKQFFIDRFNSLKLLTQWASKSTFTIRDDIMGCTSLRRIAHSECSDATHFIWLDTDIFFDDKVLFYIENSIDAISKTSVIDKYVISPECVRYWDVTWDCLVNDNFLSKPIDYQRTNNPFIDSGEVGNVSLETLINTLPGQPKMKFGGGWFNCISKPLLDRVPLPESMGHYGPDDTFLMFACDELNSRGEEIHQFKMKNYVVCENSAYRDRTYWNTLIRKFDRKEEFRRIAQSAFQTELLKIV